MCGKRIQQEVKNLNTERAVAPHQGVVTGKPCENWGSYFDKISDHWQPCTAFKSYEEPMNPQEIFCPNMECPARGQKGKGNLQVHSQKDGRVQGVKDTIEHLIQMTQGTGVINTALTERRKAAFRQRISSLTQHQVLPKQRGKPASAMLQLTQQWV
ncbi:MAG: hypothetical protein L6Q49_19260, partial [Anaerolineales bacterium]|nr:hypothetical protein [Anaerolineales bacterium]